MTIPAKVREDAALICAIAASGGVTMPNEPDRSGYYDDIAEALGLKRRGPAWRLAHNAWFEACPDHAWTRQTDAEAEALLRTGWSP